MKIVEKVITGYATTYTTAKQYSSSYPWSNVPNAFDWSPSNTSWKDTYASAKIYWSTGSSYEWYLDGISTFKSFLDDNLDDAYGKTGYEYTNFSCIPDGSELTRIDFLVRSSLAKYFSETIGYYKDGTVVEVNSSGTTYVTLKNTKSSAISVTENRVVDGTTYNHEGHRWIKGTDGIFYNINYTDDTVRSDLYIGSWNLDDFKRGAFTPRVRCKSNSSSADTANWNIYSVAVKLYCKIPQCEIRVSSTDSKAGTVTGGGNYFPGRLVTVIATPNVGYKFKRWRLNGVDTDFTTTSVSFEVTTDANIEAVFEQDAYVMYDTVFSYQKWYDAGITSSSCEVSNITEEGFTLKSLHSGNDGFTNESPMCEVKPNTRYRVDIDCEGTGWEIFVFFHLAGSSSWSSFHNTAQTSSVFTTPANCSHISMRIDANTHGNTIRVSNIRIYPAEYEYMSNTVATAQRSDKIQLSLPDRVVRYGYLFDGWNTEIDGSGTRYEEGTAFPTDSVVLYSQWLIPIMFRGKFAKSLLKDGKNTDYMQMNGKVFPENPLYLPVRFLNYDGSLVREKYVLFGHNVDIKDITSPTQPPTNTTEYQFSHWEGTLDKIHRPQNILARYTSSTRHYTTRFGYYDYYNKFITIKSQELEYLEEPTAPDATRSSEIIGNIFYEYEFTGWDKQINPATEEVDYIAQYRVTQTDAYTITWVVKNLQIQTKCPVGLVPTPPAGYGIGDKFEYEGVNYEVIGWDTALSPAQGNKTYHTVAKVDLYLTSFCSDGVNGGGRYASYYTLANGEEIGGITYSDTHIVWGFNFSVLESISNVQITGYQIDYDCAKLSHKSYAYAGLNIAFVTDFDMDRCYSTDTDRRTLISSNYDDGYYVGKNTASDYIARSVKNTMFTDDGLTWMNQNIGKVINKDVTNSFGIFLDGTSIEDTYTCYCSVKNFRLTLYYSYTRQF